MRVLAVLIALLCATARAEPPRLEVGAHFPDLELPALDADAALSISDFRGKKIVLHIFASW